MRLWSIDSLLDANETDRRQKHGANQTATLNVKCMNAIEKMKELLTCPLSMQKIVHPVVDPTCGVTCDKKMLVSWVQSKNTSPFTREHLTEPEIVRNVALVKLNDILSEVDDPQMRTHTSDQKNKSGGKQKIPIIIRCNPDLRNMQDCIDRDDPIFLNMMHPQPECYNASIIMGRPEKHAHQFYNHCTTQTEKKQIYKELSLSLLEAYSISTVHKLIRYPSKRVTAYSTSQYPFKVQSYRSDDSEEDNKTIKIKFKAKPLGCSGGSSSNDDRKGHQTHKMSNDYDEKGRHRVSMEESVGTPKDAKLSAMSLQHVGRNGWRMRPYRIVLLFLATGVAVDMDAYCWNVAKSRLDSYGIVAHSIHLDTLVASDCMCLPLILATSKDVVCDHMHLFA